VSATLDPVLKLDGKPAEHVAPLMDHPAYCALNNPPPKHR
jgi:hypothetical protein